MSIQNKLENLVFAIKDKHSLLDAESQRLRAPAFVSSFNQNNYHDWCRATVGDALIKLRLFTEQNFNFIETMGVLAVTRYTFELSIWLRLFELDPQYGLVYASQLIDSQRRYWQDQEAQLKREIVLLTALGEEEEELIALETRKYIQSRTSEETTSEGPQYQTIADMIDLKAARKFSIYADQAKHNGYGFIAHQIEHTALPQAEKSLEEILLKESFFHASLPQAIADLIPKRWNWRDMAKKVGMLDEYDYIYTFTSKLMHATPSSLTTNAKNLEAHEIYVFLKFVEIKFSDAIEAAKKY
ncbi:hypothetical protein [Pseudomonas sp. 37 R 15]|uniref:DUF5677 domain-containing protein n=1 Tax=Pseudomonas sp. 37 R 15 TaxID=1844104 RepID=UPI0008122E76|nr:DUF5677 domain-containing protein [Pseudomonas sp. 37 R 15]CRM68940.1 hypothetical protein [Pseudomonas sp. 37 R 15]